MHLTGVLSALHVMDCVLLRYKRNVLNRFYFCQILLYEVLFVTGTGTFGNKKGVVGGQSANTLVLLIQTSFWLL